MKYKKWISEFDIRRPEFGEICHCILVDVEGINPPYQEIMVYERKGFRIQYGYPPIGHCSKFKVVFWRSIPDFPDMSALNFKTNKN